MRLFVWFVLASMGLFAQDRLDEYLKFIKEHKLDPTESHKMGAIEIVTDRTKIESIEKLVKMRLEAKGFSKEEAEAGSRVGIIAQDQYWLWIRDAVIFPTGLEETYNRILWRAQVDEPTAVVGVPIFRDGSIGLILHYRHATRSWLLEFPGGLRGKGETLEEAAKRQFEDEAGCKIKGLLHLGQITPDSGVTPTVFSIYLGDVEHMTKNKPDPSEAIRKLCIFSQKELEKACFDGEISVSIDGKMTTVKCQDPAIGYVLQYLTRHGHTYEGKAHYTHHRADTTSRP